MISFKPHPEIAINDRVYDPGVHKAVYRHDYEAIFRDIADGKLPEIGAYRQLLLDDLFFMVCFGMGIEKANHPFVVNRCRDVQDGPVTDTLDVWARYHYKDLDSTTPILTTDGFKQHGELIAGDMVFSPSGNPVKVVATRHYTTSACRKITFDNGVSINCGAGHLWKVLASSRKRVSGTKNKRIPRKELIVDTTDLSTLKSQFRPVIKNTEPIQYPHINLPIDPYVLGAWLGDGYSRCAAICGEDEGIFEEIRHRGYELREARGKRGESYRVHTIKGLSSQLRELNLIQNKHIPDIYFHASAEQRLSLLQGLIDTDGNISVINNCVTFTQKDYSLSTQVKFLANGLGFKARLTPMRSVGAYQVVFQADKSQRPCLLKRKLDLLTNGKRRIGSNGWRVHSIEEIETVPTNCIQVDSEDGMYLAGEELIPTHNSVIITQAETIQYHLKHPDHCTGIHAYVRPAAKAFLRSIKNLLEQSALLKACFPDVLWGNPSVEAPKWSEDDGLVFKRGSSSRKESTIEAWGLTEGMPTGRHFERNIFDDIETDDIKDSADMLDKVYSKFEMAGNLGTGSDSDIVRVIGTYYSHFGPIVRIQEKKYEDGRPMYVLRVIPGSDNGERDGNPVLMEPKTWEKAKQSIHFNSQQLCNPTPMTEIRLDKNMLKPIEPKFMPRELYKFMVLDQAGGDETDKQSKDLWSCACIGVQPCLDDIGQSNIYILDVEADKMSHSEGINSVVTMYLRNGIIEQMGVEKVGLSTTEIHISNALRMKGRRISLDGGNLVLLKPSGRSKERRVEAALQWPLNNGKIFYSTDIPRRYIDAIREEMDKFPFYHVDILDAIAYVYDMIKTYRFQYHRDLELIEMDDEPVVETGRSMYGGY